MKISVTGIRGKSSFVQWTEEILRNRGYNTLAKVTGEKPFWIHNGEIIPIIRKNEIVLLNETLEYKKYKFDYFIAENQGIRPYTMKIFNDMVQPDIVTITNIRTDHTDTMGSTKEDICQSMGYSSNIARYVISGEEDSRLNSIIHKHCPKTRFIRSEIPHLKVQTPLNTLIGLIDSTLSTSGLDKLSTKEIDILFEHIYRSMSIKDIGGYTSWFDGAKLNDVDSTKNVFDFLVGKYPDKKFSIVAYLRDDRAERTRTFISWFENISKMDRVRQIFLVGKCAEYILRTVKNKIKIIKDSTLPDDVISFCDGSVVFTSCNSVNPFMVRLKNRCQELAMT